MSHSAAILRKRSRPRGWERSSVTHSTLRRSCIQLVATPGPPSRAGRWTPSKRHPTSPAPGRSTWITSAPISAHIAAAKGWAISVPVETTRTPCSGPNGSGTRDFPAIPIFYLCENVSPDDALFADGRATEARGQAPSCRAPAGESAFNHVHLRAIISGVRLQLLYWSKLVRLARLRVCEFFLRKEKARGTSERFHTSRDNRMRASPC